MTTPKTQQILLFLHFTLHKNKKNLVKKVQEQERTENITLMGHQTECSLCSNQ